MNRLVLNNLIVLKNGSRAKKNYSECVYNTFFLNLLKYFYKKNYILGYVFIKKFKIRIYYKYYKEKGVFDNLLIPSKLDSIVTYNNLTYLYKKSQKMIQMEIFLLTTNGFFLLSDYMRFNLRVGGKILFILYL